MQQNVQSFTRKFTNHSLAKVIDVRKFLKKLLVAYINAYKDIPPGAMH
ncbi:stress response protein AzuC [Dickeya dadantii]|nr:stress response protein AzuC [Dickeya dadantii]NPE53559.1 stress response protein AzuC [Dickeya dadantii]NPE56828.1 stress response protein AzuC [Dickeya dadantii]NPE58799.1 stress response protein AzuC [Dickeya dadantii]NPE68580.1 stress response protein AzuC [Dickeya dadantii]